MSRVPGSSLRALRRVQRRGAAAFLAAFVCATGLHAPARSAPQHPAPHPGAQSAPAFFQPGVHIDWRRRAVWVDSRVILRDEPLEFLACFAGKEHESLLRLDASGAAVFQALGLLGFEPGRPPQLDADGTRRAAAEGDRLAIALRWEAHGESQEVDAWDWLQEIEFARPALPRSWVFTGSRLLDDSTLASDLTGEGIALVDMPDCLIGLSRSHTSRNAELWVAPRTERIPALETRITVVLRAAAPAAVRATLDERGAIRVADRWTSVEDFADLVQSARAAGSTEPALLESAGSALRADVLRVRRQLAALGVTDAELRGPWRRLPLRGP